MRKWNKKTKIAVFIIFLILAVLFAALCWKKRRGIYNTYMKLTGQEIPYSVQEKRRKKYGYYDQELNASMNLENPVYITEKDDSANEIETDIPKETTRIASSYENPPAAAGRTGEWIQLGGAYGDPESLSGFSIDSGDYFRHKRRVCGAFYGQGKNGSRRYQWRSGSCCFTQNPGDRTLPGNGKHG